jgi:beta-lactamase regulating signal transducer with metallopeptidase domain/lipopolysaccharide export system protein LptA
MTAADILDSLLKANLASGAAILAVVALRKWARSRFGARLAYGLWLAPVLAGAAVLLPARQVTVVETAAPVAAAVHWIGRGLTGSPAPVAATAPTGLDAQARMLGLWLAGALGAALLMAVLQHRFVARARRGGVGPAVVGLIAPRILVPGDFAERYSAGEQALVLALERAHLARQDSRLNALAAALQCLCWFNPLVHLAARLMRVDQELACDEAVVRRFPEARRAYAEVLMKAQMAVMPLPLGSYWPPRGQKPLVERVAMLKRPRIGQARWRAGAVALGCLWAGVGVAAWASQPVQVRTVFKAAPARPEPELPSTFALAKADQGARNHFGPPPPPSDAVKVEGDHFVRQDEQHRSEFIGHVQMTSKGARLEADRLDVYDYGPKDAGRPGVKHAVAEGHVRVDVPTVAARADKAVYAGPPDTITLSGHVVVERGKGTVTNDRLVIPVKGLGPLSPRVSDNSRPPMPIPLARSMAETVDKVEIVNARRIDRDAILSILGIHPGDTVTVDKVNAADKAMFDSGLFSDWRIQSPPPGGEGDLRVWVKEKPAPAVFKATVAEGPRGAAGKDEPVVFPMRADESFHDEAHHIDILKGNVTFNGLNAADDRVGAVPGWRILSDLLVLPSVPPGEPGVADAKKITWEGHVLVNHGEDAARADYAYYDIGSKTLTLTGHVSVPRGRWLARNDRLVIDAKGMWTPPWSSR